MACYQHNAQTAAQQRPRLILKTHFSRRTIVSYGFMVYARDTQRWLVVQRKHSVEFILLLRGDYCYSHLPLIVPELTRAERSIVLSLLSCNVSTYARYLRQLGLEPDAAEHGHAQLLSHYDTLATLLANIDPRPFTLWTWPKGRCGWSETPLACAMREYEEEVSLPFPTARSFISSSYYSHTFPTLQGADIVSRCWLCVVDHEFPLPQPVDNPEVNASRWAVTTELPTLMGPSAFLPPLPCP